tara:strand:- start:1627 stop:2625 length:999 start_codon:yes stop_codon:yes gene_type:complete
MQISKEELQKIIKEEVNEIFGFGKKEPTKEYPASELVGIIRGLEDASKRSGAELTPAQREAIVDELTGVLEDEGFVVKENERLFTGEEDVVVTHQNAPKLKVFLDTIAQKSPKVFKQLLGVFNRSALDISPVVKSIADNIPSILTVADLEPDEDQTDTIVAEPVAVPDEEDQTDTIVAEPVAGPDPDQEDQTDTIVAEPVAAPDPEDEEEDIPSILTVADLEPPKIKDDDIIRRLEIENPESLDGPARLLVKDFPPGDYKVVARADTRGTPRAGDLIYIRPVGDKTNKFDADDAVYEITIAEYPELFKKLDPKRKLKEHKQLKRMKVLAGIK